MAILLKNAFPPIVNDAVIAVIINPMYSGLIFNLSDREEVIVTPAEPDIIPHHKFGAASKGKTCSFARRIKNTVLRSNIHTSLQARSVPVCICVALPGSNRHAAWRTCRTAE